MVLDNFKTQMLIWDKAEQIIHDKYQANSGDSNGRKLRVQVLDGGSEVNLAGVQLHLAWRARGNKGQGLDALTPVDITKGIFEIAYTTEMLSHVGEVPASLVLIQSSGRTESSEFIIRIAKSIVDDDSVQSDNSFTALTSALVDVSQLEETYAPRLNQVTTQLAETATKAELSVERARIDNFTQLDSGTTTGDAELIDGRIGADGIPYTNIGNAIRGQISAITYTDKVSIGKSLSNFDGVYNNSYWGSQTRYVKPSAPLISVSLTTKVSTEKAVIRCRVWSDDKTKLLAETSATLTKTIGEIEIVTFKFDTVVTITDDNFYLSIWSENAKISLVSTPIYNSNLCSADTTKPNYYISVSGSTNGTSGWSPSPVTAYYADVNFYTQVLKLKVDSDTILPILKSDVLFFMPKKVYTWADGIIGDWLGKRNPKIGVYLDHAIPYNTDKGIINTVGFENVSQKNRLEFATPQPLDWTKANINNGLKKQEIEKTYSISGDRVNSVTGKITQISVRNDVGEDTFVANLTIGDSTVEGANAFITNVDGTQPWSTFWNEVARQFAMDSIEADSVDKYKFISLGTRTGKGGISTVEFLGKTRTITTATNGESGSKLADHLRYVTQKRPSQIVWDSLGLGNGTGSDYKGTSLQRDLIAKTNEVYLGTESNYNGNPFFDQNKTGNNRFSILKWLERYRTLDNTGKRLTLGNGTGTKINSENIDKINVCTPTHVTLQTGLNDWSQVSVEQYLADMDVFVNEIRTQLPNAKIAITLFPDDPGTYFRELYPNIMNCDMASLHNSTRPYITALQEHFESSEYVDLLPNYFVMPPAVSTSYIWLVNDDGTQTKHPFGPASIGYHSNGYAHKAWGNQLYAWIKSTLV